MNKKIVILLVISVFILAGCEVSLKSKDADKIKKDLTEKVTEGVDEGVETAKDEIKEEIVKELSAKELTLTGNKIEPNNITVLKDDEIKIKVKNEGEKIYGFYLPEFNVTGSVDPGDTETFSFKADKAGTFNYSCNLNCDGNVTGQLIVK